MYVCMYVCICICICVCECVCIYIHGYRRTDVMKLIVTFRNLANAPQSIWSSHTLQHFSTWRTLRASQSGSRYEAEVDECPFLVIHGCSINWISWRLGKISVTHLNCVSGIRGSVRISAEYFCIIYCYSRLVSLTSIFQLRRLPCAGS